MAQARRRSITTELRTIRRHIAAIDQALARLAPRLRALGSARADEGTRPVRRLKLSPARRAALKLQGQYMGYVRGLRPRQKTQVKAERAAKGLRAAINLAKTLAKG